MVIGWVIRSIDGKKNWRKCGRQHLRKQTRAIYLNKELRPDELLVGKALKWKNLEIWNEVVV